MDIYHAIDATIQRPPRKLAQAQALLSQYSLDVQAQLIAAVYLGRDHIHSTTMRDDTDWTHRAVDHISTQNYAQILFEKSSSNATTKYLTSLLRCSKASEYDLNKM